MGVDDHLGEVGELDVLVVWVLVMVAGEVEGGETRHEAKKLSELARAIAIRVGLEKGNLVPREYEALRGLADLGERQGGEIGRVGKIDLAHSSVVSAVDLEALEPGEAMGA
jgi:hypothetical protein